MSAARKSRAGDAFGRMASATAANPAPSGDTTVSRHHDTAEQGEPPAQNATSRHRGVTTPKVEPVRRFTVRFYDQGDADALDLWLMDARRHLGHKVDQARVVRELLRMVADDPELTARVYARLREGES